MRLIAVVIALFAAAGIMLVAFGGGYQEDFTGTPATPEPLMSSNMAVSVHHRNFPGEVFPAMTAQHGPTCAAPPATHPIDDRSQAIYKCLNHLMTAILGAPYGTIMLTPAALVDWSSGSATITWEQSTARASARDYTSMWITPFEKMLALPADAFIDVDLQGQPDQAVTVLLDLFTDRISPDAFGVPKEVCFSYGCYGYDEVHGVPFSSVAAPDSARRDKFELTITPTTLLLRMPLYNHTLFFAHRAIPLPFTSGIVQFGHHSYSPEKGCDAQYAPSVGTGGQVCGGGTTWHWDGFRIEPAIPITLYNAAPSYQGGSPGTYRYTWGQPALVGSRLEFSAIGTVEVSYGGAFAAAPRQKADYDPAKVSMYLIPVPAGATYVDLRLNADGSAQSFQLHAKDLHLWSAASAGSQTPTVPTATLSPSPTPTSSPISTPTSTPAPTVIPSPTVMPTPTAAPSGSCEVRWNGSIVRSEQRTLADCRLK